MPTETLLERSRRRAQAAQAAVETPRSSSPLRDATAGSSPNPFAPPSQLSNPLANRTNLRAIGDRLLKKVKLDVETEAEFRKFIEVNLFALPLLPGVLILLCHPPRRPVRRNEMSCSFSIHSKSRAC
jgi:hypothetical protein